MGFRPVQPLLHPISSFRSAHAGSAAVQLSSRRVACARQPVGCPRAMSPDCPSRRRWHRPTVTYSAYHCGSSCFRGRAAQCRIALPPFSSTRAARILIPWHRFREFRAAGVCSDRLVAFAGDGGSLCRCRRFRGCRLLLADAGGNRPDDEIGIVLASGAGALGVRLGMPVMEAVKFPIVRTRHR